MSSLDVSIIRIIDANANRCREGLRVLEEVARFVMDDAFLTAIAKDLRHDLELLIAEIPAARRIVARDTIADVGTTLTAQPEVQRRDIPAVIAANARRVEEGLRCVEEFGKLVSEQLATGAKALRYRVYTLEKALQKVIGARERLAAARLYVLLGAQSSPKAFAQLVQVLVDVGVPILQLRAKGISDREFLHRAEILRNLTRATATLCVINDRPDIAAIVGADGVHLGQEDLPLSEARKIVGPDVLIGISTHNLRQAEEAVLAGADYIGVGPVFPSQTKQFESFPGLALVREVCARISLPAFAIGGITLENLQDVLAAGACRVAVSSAIVGATDPAAVAREFLQTLAAVKSQSPGVGSEAEPERD
jgi:thiamine-phosphate pyrophosphorylase